MTIVPRNGKFGVKVWDSEQKRYRWIGSFETEAEAAQSERDAALKPGRDVPTVEQWGRIWLSDYARPAPATRQVYRQAVKVIAAELGALRLSKSIVPARKAAKAGPGTPARSRARCGRTRGGTGSARRTWSNLRWRSPAAGRTSLR